MSSEPLHLLGILGVCCGTLLCPDGRAASPPGASLQARPATCVAVHRGQVCYARVRLSWSVPDEAGYCLRAIDDEGSAELVCWRGSERVHIAHEYASASAVRYELVRDADGELVGETRVRTAWVYRTNRRSASGWRLF